MDIPEGATEIHGITTARAQLYGVQPVDALEEIAREMTLTLQSGVPLVGMNLAYDITLFDRDLRRNGLDTVEQRLCAPIAPVIDIRVLDKYIEPFRPGGRKLIDLCEVYGVRIDRAHNSTFDALASTRVAYKIGQRSQMNLDELVKIYRDRKRPHEVARAIQSLGRLSLAELHEAQIRWFREQCDGLRAHFNKTGVEHDGVPGDWPIRPYVAPAAAAERSGVLA
jgi:DNA polymerase-3 subunit epsilon